MENITCNDGERMINKVLKYAHIFYDILMEMGTFYISTSDWC